MESASDSTFFRRLFPRAGPELLRLYAGSAERAGLAHADYYTIRDLLELAGYLEDEPLHVLLLALTLAVDEGSVCIQASSTGLARRLGGLVDDDECRACAERAALALQAGNFPELISERVDAGKPVVLRRVRSEAYLYFQKHLAHELLLDRELHRRLDARPNYAADGVADTLREVTTDQVPRLSDDQRRAVALALLRGFVIVTGGPGTGKTSVVCTLVRCLVHCTPTARIALAAPTGRAAQRLTDALQAGWVGRGEPDARLADLSASTLHSLLGYNPATAACRHHADNPLPYDTVIVDEVSMVGLTMTAQLFQALRPDCRLVLLGDKDQLPSVDTGAVLASLVAADPRPGYTRQLHSAAQGLDLIWPEDSGGPLTDVLVVLEHNHRSEPAITDLAQAINAQRTEIVDRLPLLDSAPGTLRALGDRPGCWLMEAAHADARRWRSWLAEWAEQHFLTSPDGGRAYCDLLGECVVAGYESTPAQRPLLDRLFALLGRARILTLVRDGLWGSVGVNDTIERTLRSRLDRGGSRGEAAGLPVLVTRNDAWRGLYNGDVGITLRAAAGDCCVAFPRRDGYALHALDSLPAREMAFALTVHKSQGTEYGQVVLALPPQGAQRLLTKEIIYTGVTRARRQVIVAGNKEILRAAISRRIERDSLLLAAHASPAL